MQRTMCAALLLMLLLSPVFPAEAKVTDTSTSSASIDLFASSSASSTLIAANTWLQKTFGVDLYTLIRRVVNFLIVAVRISIDVLLDLLPKIREFLSGLNP